MQPNQCQCVACGALATHTSWSYDGVAHGSRCLWCWGFWTQHQTRRYARQYSVEGCVFAGCEESQAPLRGYCAVHVAEVDLGIWAVCREGEDEDEAACVCPNRVPLSEIYEGETRVRCQAHGGRAYEEETVRDLADWHPCETDGCRAKTHPSRRWCLAHRPSAFDPSGAALNGVPS